MFVIARSTSDEAIELHNLDCFAPLAMTESHNSPIKSVNAATV
jgi:hypothetical protein